MCPICPYVCSMFARAHGPSNRGLVKNGPAGTRSDGMRPDAGPLCRSAPPLPPLDQWSRPSRWIRSAPEVPYTDVVT
jgi:hypothetical protein